MSEDENCFSRYYQYLEEARIGGLDGLVLLTTMHYFLRPVDHLATVLVRWYADRMIDRRDPGREDRL